MNAVEAHRKELAARLATAESACKRARKAYAVAIDKGNAHGIEQARIRHVRAMDDVEVHREILHDECPWLNDPAWIAARDRAESEDRADMLAGRGAYAPNA